MCIRDSLWCEGSMIVDGAQLTCTGNHGSQTIEQALANSCNCAFGTLALELGPDIMAEYAETVSYTHLDVYKRQPRGRAELYPRRDEGADKRL